MTIEPDHKPPRIIIYETDDKVARVSVRLEDETVWLTQQQVSDLYGTSRPNVTMHIKNIFSDGELNEDAVCKKCLQTAADGKNYEVLFYNLDMIISLGYRINSKVATRFRQWATVRLREYIIKGFTMDDARLKELGGVYREVIGKHFPAMTCVEVAALMEARAKVEIEVTGVLPD